MLIEIGRANDGQLNGRSSEPIAPALLKKTVLKQVTRFQGLQCLDTLTLVTDIRLLFVALIQKPVEEIC